jgi:hypothetical protein
MKKKKQEQFAKKWAQVIAKAWIDEEFKEKLLKNPAKTLAAMGIEIPAGQKIEIHAGSEKVIHLVLPQKPAGVLSEQDLIKLVGGAGQDCTCVPQCVCQQDCGHHRCGG